MRKRAAARPEFATRAMVTAPELIRERAGSVPAALRDRMTAAVNGGPEESEAVSDRLLEAAERMLVELISAWSAAGQARANEPRIRSRSDALELLAVDALVTLAVQAAAEECNELADTADAAVERLSLLAARLGS